jgi:hypothetical protein
MPKCRVPLGGRISEISGMHDIREYVDDVAKAFIDEVEKRLGQIFFAGAVCSSRDIACTTSTQSTFMISNPSIGEMTKTATSVRTMDFSHHTEPSIEESSETNLVSASPVVFGDCKCCKFYGSITPFGNKSVTMELKFTVKKIDVTVKFALTLQVIVAGSNISGICNPPLVCEDETLSVDLKIIVEGTLTIFAGKELDLGPLGKVQAGGAGLILKVKGDDVVSCTINCKEKIIIA